MMPMIVPRITIWLWLCRLSYIEICWFFGYDYDGDKK